MPPRAPASSGTTAARGAEESPGPVLLFDGECGLCQRLVRLLLRWDRRGRLHFAALQSPPAQTYLCARGLPTRDFDSLVFVPDWTQRERGPASVETAPVFKTDGVIAALRTLDSRALRFMAALITLIPRALRDLGYRAVARVRYRVFGPWQPRPLKRPEWRARFIEGGPVE